MINTLYKFIGPHEIIAFLAAAIFLAGGLYLALFLEEIWLNRTGALIIIVGVLLASSRFHEKKLIEMRAKSEKEFESHFKTLGQVYEGWDKVMDALENVNDIKTNINIKKIDLAKKIELVEMESELKTLIKEMYDELHTKSKIIIKKYEIILIVLGTLLNGFGDLLILLVRHYLV